MIWWMVILGYYAIGFVASAVACRLMYGDLADGFLWFCIWPIMLVVTPLWALWKWIAGEW